MGPSCKAPASNVLTTVACIFWRKKAPVQSVWADYVKVKRVTVKALPWNSQSKIYQQTIPRSKMILCHIIEFIHKPRDIRERVLAKDIMILLRSLGYLEYFPDYSLIKSNAVRSVQHYLVCKGFHWGDKKGSQHYRLKYHILEKRNEYVRCMMK